MRPIIRWSLRMRRTNTFWWCLGILAFLMINLVFYPSFKDSAAELQKSFDSIPKAALSLLGGSNDFFSPIGYLNSQVMFLMLPLLLSILAISLGRSLVGREEEDMTVELLLARPVSRGRLLAAKALAGTCTLALVSLVSLAATIGGAKLFDIAVPAPDIALACANCFLLALATGAVVFLAVATGRGRGAALGIGALVGFGGYMISSLSGTVQWLHGPAKVFPFNYYQSEAILRGTYHWASALYFVVLIAGCGILSYVAFRRRDIG